MRRSSRHILIRWLRRRVFPHKLSCRVTSLRGYSSTSQDRQKEGDMVMQAQGGVDEREEESVRKRNQSSRPLQYCRNSYFGID